MNKVKLDINIEALKELCTDDYSLEELGLDSTATEEQIEEALKLMIMDALDWDWTEE